MTRRLNTASAWQKLHRADHHLNTLDEELGAWVGSEDDPVIVQRWQDEPELHYTSVYVERLKPIPDHWSLLIGDALNNYRSCLDHLAYALVRCGTDSAKLRSDKFCVKVEFPMDRGKASVARRLPGVASNYLRALAPFQPGKRPGVRRWQLGTLRRLNNVDKHREPLLTYHALSVTHTLSGSPPPVRVEVLPSTYYPKPGAELVRLIWLYGKPPVRVREVRPILDTQNPSMDVKFDPTCTVIFRQRLARREVTTVLFAISEVLWKILQATEGV